MAAGPTPLPVVPPSVNDWITITKDPGDWQPVQHGNSVADTLKDQGFWDSFGHVLMSPLAAIKEMATPHSRAERLAQVQKAVDIAGKYINGTDEEKAAARDQMLAAVPGGSTAIKLREGNLAGAGGDVAGMVALGGVAKVAGELPGAVSRFSDVMENAPPASATAKALSGGAGYVLGHKISGDWMGGFAGGAVGRAIADKIAAFPSAIRAAIGAGTAEVETGLVTPESLAGGKEALAKLSKDDQAILKTVADAQNRMKTETTAVPAPPAPAPAPSPSAAPGKTAAQMLQEELAANRAPAPVAPPVAAPPVVVSARIPPQPIPPGAVRAGRLNPEIYSGTPITRPLPPPLASPQSVADLMTKPATTPEPLPEPPLPVPANRPATAAPPVPSTLKLDPVEIARQLKEEGEKSGTFVKPEPPTMKVDKEVYEGGAREVRADRAGKLADLLKLYKFGPESIVNLDVEALKNIADVHKIDFPTTPGPQAKLLRDTLAAFDKGKQTISDMMR